MSFEHLPENLKAICEGRRPDLSPEKLAGYSRLCKQEALRGKLLASGQAVGIAVATPAIAFKLVGVPRGKPGTKLTELFLNLGVPYTPGCNCENAARVMDALGVEGCREEQNSRTLLAMIRENAKKLSFYDKLRLVERGVLHGLTFKLSASGLYHEAIRRAEAELVQQAGHDSP